MRKAILTVLSILILSGCEGVMKVDAGIDADAAVSTSDAAIGPEVVAMDAHVEQ